MFTALVRGVVSPNLDCVDEVAWSPGVLDNMAAERPKAAWDAEDAADFNHAPGVVL